MAKVIDLKGQVFGRLTVLSEEGKASNGNIVWKCQCSCGNTKNIVGGSLRKGDTTSCGCLRDERIKETNTKHGLTKHPLYRVWLGMKDRCYNEKFKQYQDYGGKGVTVCDSWKYSFENFYSDVVEKYRKGLQIDRIDNNGNYEPDNVRWVTPQQNTMNRGGRLNCTSKYKGVYWDEEANKWRAGIQKSGKVYRLGMFTDETEAAKAYNEKAKELFGEYANLNKIGEDMQTYKPEEVSLSFKGLTWKGHTVEDFAEVKIPNITITDMSTYAKDHPDYSDNLVRVDVRKIYDNEGNAYNGSFKVLKGSKTHNQIAALDPFDCTTLTAKTTSLVESIVEEGEMENVETWSAGMIWANIEYDKYPQLNNEQGFVKEEDYNKLLQAYKELKHRMEGLEE